jgi:hypothetical protein
MVFDTVTTKTSDTWITPRSLVACLGLFDLDPCAHVDMPFHHAKKEYTILDDGLTKEWSGRVWLNPPYSKAKQFMEKLANHGNGIAFIYTRVETGMFFEYVWDRADAVFFFKGRIKCIRENGETCSSPPASNCLVAYGSENVLAIKNSGLIGKLIKLKDV